MKMFSFIIIGRRDNLRITPGLPYREGEAVSVCQLRPLFVYSSRELNHRREGANLGESCP